MAGKDPATCMLEHNLVVLPWQSSLRGYIENQHPLALPPSGTRTRLLFRSFQF